VSIDIFIKSYKGTEPSEEKKIVFYHNVLGNTHADIEDLFSLADYLAIYNGAFNKNITVNEIDVNKPLLIQLKKKNGDKDFNHYIPANYFAKNTATIVLSGSTLDNFEKLFTILNKLI
jgi:hypothetical protein